MNWEVRKNVVGLNVVAKDWLMKRGTKLTGLSKEEEARWYATSIATGRLAEAERCLATHEPSTEFSERLPYPSS